MNRCNGQKRILAIKCDWEDPTEKFNLSTFCPQKQGDFFWCYFQKIYFRMGKEKIPLSSTGFICWFSYCCEGVVIHFDKNTGGRSTFLKILIGWRLSKTLLLHICVYAIFLGLSCLSTNFSFSMFIDFCFSVLYLQGIAMKYCLARLSRSSEVGSSNPVLGFRLSVICMFLPVYAGYGCCYFFPHSTSMRVWSRLHDFPFFSNLKLQWVPYLVSGILGFEHNSREAKSFSAVLQRVSLPSELGSGQWTIAVFWFVIACWSKQLTLTLMSVSVRTMWKSSWIMLNSFLNSVIRSWFTRSSWRSPFIGLSFSEEEESH